MSGTMTPDATDATVWSGLRIALHRGLGHAINIRLSSREQEDRMRRAWVELDKLRERLERAEQAERDLSDVMGLLQRRLQPDGSPPAGTVVTLADWITQSALLRITEGEAERAGMDAMLRDITDRLQACAQRHDLGPGVTSMLVCTELDRLAVERATVHDDIAAILEALGLGGHARQQSAHAVVRGEIIPAVLSLAARDIATGPQGEPATGTEAQFYRCDHGIAPFACTCGRSIIVKCTDEWHIATGSGATTCVCGKGMLAGPQPEEGSNG